MIGGPGAFVIPIRERDQFKDAIRTKLVLEIAGRTPERRVVPVASDKPARLLHHRRAVVAGALGQLALDPLGREARHRRTWRSDGRLRFARRRPAAIRWGITVRVLIVGGGIAGMSLAIGLRAPASRPRSSRSTRTGASTGAGITITGPTLRAFDQLGLLERVVAEGYCYDTTRICDTQAASSWPSRVSGQPLGRVFRTAAASCGRCCTASCPKPRAQRARRCASASASPGSRRCDAAVAVAFTDGYGRELRSCGRRRRRAFAPAPDAVSGRAGAGLHRARMLAGGGAAAAGIDRAHGLRRRPVKAGIVPVSRDGDVPVPAAARSRQSAHAGGGVAGAAGGATAGFAGMLGSSATARGPSGSTTGRWKC